MKQSIMRLLFLLGSGGGLTVRSRQYHRQWQQRHFVTSFVPSPSTWSRSSRALPAATTRRRDLSLSSSLSSSSSYTLHETFDDDIIDRYDAFILDQFGVLHNGVDALDGAIELVRTLRRRGKRLIILSNTSAPVSKAIEKLPKFGFVTASADKQEEDDDDEEGQNEEINGQNLFDDAVTSGEESSKYIRETFGRRDNSNISPKKSKVLMFTWDTRKTDNPRLTASPEMYLDQCGDVEVATSVHDADFVLFHGSEVWYRGPNEEPVSLSPFIEDGRFGHCDDDVTSSTTSPIDRILKECLAVGKNLPAVCANPDYIVQTPSGDGVAFMPGKIAQRYEELGGTCTTFGKPGIEHFEACITKLDGIEKHRVAHVGDSLHHDIAGAANANIPCIFVTSGIHKLELGTAFGELPPQEKLEEVMTNEIGTKIRPTHVVPAFKM